jgi:4-hydroxy-2-oxoglutarate aldolase
LPDAGLKDRLGGVFLPVTTPYDAHTGDVSPVAMRENLRALLDEPIDGIVLFGSTGEGALLDESEKVRLTGFARDVVPAGIPLMAGTGGESTRVTIRQARELAAAGAEVVLVHPPAYFGPYLSPAALREHFRAVADGSPVPVILYHIPKYTKVTLEAGLVAELTRHPNVAGLKDSSGDIKRFADFTNACGSECRLFIGNASLLYTALELGAAGGIMAAAVVAPALCAELVRAFRAGESGRAGQIQGRLTPLHKEIVVPFGGAGVKVALDLLGLAGGAPRPPLEPLGEKERRAVARVMQEAGLL